MGHFRLGMCYLLALVFQVALSVSPYTPLDQWSYYVEARRESPWPECAYRFASYTDDCNSTVDLWNSVGENQAFTLEYTGQDNKWRFVTKCGTYLSYPMSNCGDETNNTLFITNHISDDEGSTWNLITSTDLSWKFEAAEISSCIYRYLSFENDCDNHDLFLGDENSTSTFLLHPLQAPSPILHVANTNYQGCADPFVWQDSNNGFYLACTTDNLPLYFSQTLTPTTVFAPIGSMINENAPIPDWASDTDRWAPENLILSEQVGGVFQGGELAVLCDDDSEGIRRLGTVYNPNSFATASGWLNYSLDIIHVGDTPSGEIDPHFFVDKINDNKIYLVWKTDDNSINMLYTRIWMIEIELPIINNIPTVSVIGTPKEILNSTGLWWVDSWVPSGSLIEGPEIIYKNSFYYLFFASGQFCENSYSEGVARSKNIWGPYEKLGVPLLSTSIVGYGETGNKLIGPGHSSFVYNTKNININDVNINDADDDYGDGGDWFSVWHASESTGDSCERNAYVDIISWTEDGWPFIDFTPMNTTQFP